jgi:flagellar FliL protein
MAKKPKKEAKKDEAAQDGSAKDSPPKSRKKLFMIVGAVIVVIGAGAGATFLMRKSPDAGEAHAEEKKAVAFVDIREMTVNLAPEPSQDHQRFLKFRVALEVKDPKTASEIQPLLPRVEDSFQVFVRELRASDLDGSAGVYRLREELVRRVNIAVYPAKVDAVLFKDIVIQ